MLQMLELDWRKTLNAGVSDRMLESLAECRRLGNYEVRFP